MSWSVSAAGKAADVKAVLAAQFATCKQSTAAIPHEQESVGLVEQIVNGQLDFIAGLSPQPDVNVSANGSAWTSSNGSGGSSISVKVN